MKKASIFMVIAAAAGLASCTAQAPKADLKSESDSLSYAFGLTQTQGFKEYLVQQLRVDTAYIGEVVKGIVLIRLQKTIRYHYLLCYLMHL